MSDYRLFFALWPDDRLRGGIHEIARRLPRAGPRAYAVNPDRYHVTLLYLGEIQEPELETVCAIGDAVQVPRFTLEFDKVGAFPRARVWWMGVRSPPPEVAQLGDALRDGATAAGLSFDPMPLKAHVSIMRETSGQPPQQPLRPVTWDVREFVLVSSILSPKTASYEVIRRWRLG